MDEETLHRAIDEVQRLLEVNEVVDGKGGFISDIDLSRTKVGSGNEAHNVIHHSLDDRMTDRLDEQTLEDGPATLGQLTVIELDGLLLVLIQRDDSLGRFDGIGEVTTIARTLVEVLSRRKVRGDAGRDGLTTSGDVSGKVPSKGIDERELQKEVLEGLLCESMEGNASEVV